MTHQNRTTLSATFALALAMGLSCSSPESPTTTPPVNPQGGSSTGQTGGSGPVDPGNGGTSGGSAVSGGAAGSGGADPSGAGTANGGSANGGGSGAGAGGAAPMACDYTPRANAGDIALDFVELTLPAEIPAEQGGKNQDAGGWGGDGFTLITFIPGTENEAFLLQNRGTVNHVSIPADGTTVTLIQQYDLEQVHYVKDCGLLSMAFDPDFTSNRLVYFGHCDTKDSSKISRYSFADGQLSDRQDIMTWTREPAEHEWHTIGSIDFDTDKNLWVLHGEFTISARSQDLTSNLGKLLRIVPNRTPGMGGYEPAAGNPYADEASPQNAIWAYGFRSPWHGMVNSHGHFVVGDVGGDNEEINVVTGPGQNFGWDQGTGACNDPCVSPVTVYRCGGGAGCNDAKYRAEGNPIAGARGGRAVWLGTEYGDCGSDRYAGALTGVTMFGDFVVGYFRGMVLDRAGAVVEGSDKSLGYLSTVTSVEQAPDGFLYVTTYGGPYDSVPASEENSLWRAVVAE